MLSKLELLVSYDLVSFVLWFVQTFHFCQKFPTKDVFTLNPWPTLSRQTLSRPTLIHITEPKKLHQQIWGVHIPSLKLPLWDLDLFPLLFLAVWSAPLLANFLFSTVAAVAGSTHKVPHRRLSLGEGLDLFSSQPAASQPTPFIRGSSPQNGSPSSHLDPPANGQ